MTRALAGHGAWAASAARIDSRGASTQNHRMPLGARRIAGFVALCAMLLPPMSGLAVATHLAGHDPATHFDASHAEAAGLAVVWHGHGHEAGVPEHDHPLLSPSAATPPVRPALHSAAALPFLPGFDLTSPVPRSARRCRGLAVGADPPVPPGSFSILRV